MASEDHYGNNGSRVVHSMPFSCNHVALATYAGVMAGLMRVSALAGAGKSVVLGLLMDVMMISGHHVIVLVPTRILRDETVITHGKQAGLAEDVVGDRVLWLGRPPSKSGDLRSIGMFADQLEERVTE